MAKGKFIVLEGIDGSGKTTQSNNICVYLKSKGYECFQTCEPQNDAPVGALLRRALKKEIALDEKTIALLFAADRLDHIEKIKLLLEKGICVVCDRYYFSSFAYNDTALNKEWIISVNSEAMKSLKADLTVFIDVPCDISLSRVKVRGEKTEIFENTERQSRVRSNYLELFKRFENDENIAVIDGNRAKDDVAKSIIESLEKIL